MDNDPELDSEADYTYEIFEAEEPRPFWTRRRLVLTIIVIIIVITFLAYSFSGLFVHPSLPPPTLAPGSLI